jgi:GMP synthase-like glutamine amidotransferase
VLRLPPNAVTLAASATAPHELWALAPNVLCSQFHLEFDEAIVLRKIWARLCASEYGGNGRLDAQQSAASRAVLEAGGHHSAAMLALVRHFLRYGLQWQQS